MINWDDAFDNSGYVPEAEAIRASWIHDAASFRESWPACQLDLPYGPSLREVFDIFSPEGPVQGTVIYIHGGYWHLMDKSYWSHLAAGCLANGWAFAVPSYPLAPEVRISQITQCIRMVVSKIAGMTQGPLALIGHSAGGHLVTRMACEGVLPAEVTARLRRVVSVSGVYHLAPLLTTQMNKTLQLNKDQANIESPVLLRPAAVPLTFWVGASERPEFLRQTRMISEIWGRSGADVHDVYEAGQNHFTVVCSLADPQGALTQAVLA